MEKMENINEAKKKILKEMSALAFQYCELLSPGEELLRVIPLDRVKDGLIECELGEARIIIRRKSE